MAAALFLAFLFQGAETVPYAQKDLYLPAVLDCDKALRLLRNEPDEALRILDRILNEAKLTWRERRLQIETEPGRFSHPYAFYPYQYRGRVLLRLMEKTDDRDTSLGLLRRAVADFEESVRRGLEGSGTFLQMARTKLERLEGEKPPPDPEFEFRTPWRKLLDAGRFSAAKAHVEAKAGSLAPGVQKRYFEETDQACRQFLDAALERFLARIEKVDHPILLRTMSQEGFDRDFALPVRADLVVTTQAYDWCVLVRETLVKLHEKQEPLDDLLRSTEEAAREGDARGYRVTEGLAYAALYEAIELRARMARTTPFEQRSALRKEAEALSKKWGEFTSRVIAQGRPGIVSQTPQRNLASAFEGFPIEADGLNDAVEEILASARAEDPIEALSQAVESLRDLRKDWDRYSIEIRRTLVAYQIAASALRVFLDLKTVEEVATDSEIERLGREWKALGGSSELRRFGPKVAQLFRLLLR